MAVIEMGRAANQDSSKRFRELLRLHQVRWFAASQPQKPSKRCASQACVGGTDYDHAQRSPAQVLLMLKIRVGCEKHIEC